MTVNELITLLEPQVLSLPCGEKTVRGCYTGDLLSRVMGKARPCNVWVTIMSNINVLAVASLADVSCVVIGENARPEDDVISMAETRGINLLLMPDNAYDICTKLSKIL